MMMQEETNLAQHVVPWKSSKWQPPSAEEMARIRLQAQTGAEADILNAGSDEALRGANGEGAKKEENGLDSGLLNADRASHQEHA